MAKFLKFIVNTVMIVAIVVAASLLVPPFAGVTTLIVDDIDLDTNLETGSVTYAWGVDVEELKEGDKVLLQEDGEMVYVISSIENIENGKEFVLEDKLSTDEQVITKELQGVVDKVILTVPALGYVSMALRTVEGLIIVGLSVVFVIILFVLSEIWRREEEEDWEEDEEDEKTGDDVKHEDTDNTEDDNEDIQDKETQDEEIQDNELVEDEVVQEENVSEEIVMEETFVEGILAEEAFVEESFIEETVAEEEASEEKVLAMPRYTKEELLERAKAAGDEPELIVDELSGVTFLDYSAIL